MTPPWLWGKVGGAARAAVELGTTLEPNLGGIVSSAVESGKFIHAQNSPMQKINQYTYSRIETIGRQIDNTPL